MSSSAVPWWLGRAAAALLGETGLLDTDQLRPLGGCKGTE